MTRSELVEFSKCPARWIRGYKDDDETDAMSWGALLDVLMTQPGQFMKLYAVAPESYPVAQSKAEILAGFPVEMRGWTYAAKFCKDWRDEQYEAGREVVSKKVADEAFAAQERLQEDPKILDFISRSRTQVLVQVEYEDPDTGIVVPVACLIDFAPEPNDPEYGSALADLKSCKDASKATWSREVFFRGYDKQGSLYIDAMNASSGTNYTQFFHILCENVKPFQPGRRMLDPEFLQIGRASYRRALSEYCYALKSGNFEGYDDREDIRGNNIGGWSMTSPQPWMIGDPE